MRISVGRSKLQIADDPRLYDCKVNVEVVAANTISVSVVFHRDAEDAPGMRGYSRLAEPRELWIPEGVACLLNEFAGSGFFKRSTSISESLKCELRPRLIARALSFLLMEVSKLACPCQESLGVFLCNALRYMSVFEMWNLKKGDSETKGRDLHITKD